MIKFNTNANHSITTLNVRQIQVSIDQIYTHIILLQNIIKFQLRQDAVRRTRATGMYAHLFDNGFAYFVRKQSKKECLRKVN